MHGAGNVLVRDGRSHRTEDLWTTLSRLGEDAQYQDCTLVCGDGRLAGARLLLALAVPHVGGLLGRQDEGGTTLLLPDFSVSEISEKLTRGLHQMTIEPQIDVKKELGQQTDDKGEFYIENRRERDITEVNKVFLKVEAFHPDSNEYLKTNEKDSNSFSFSFHNQRHVQNEINSQKTSDDEKNKMKKLKITAKVLGVTYECDKCDQKCKTLMTLKRHKQGKHGEMGGLKGGWRVTCDECDISLCSKRSMISHKELVHGLKRENAGEDINNLECSECGKELKTKSGYREHMSMHKGEFRYICQQCGERFVSKCIYYNHLKIMHTIGKKHECTWKGCDKKFNYANGLKRHEKIHLGSKEFQCQMCPKQFIEKHKLANHIKIHL